MECSSSLCAPGVTGGNSDSMAGFEYTYCHQPEADGSPRVPPDSVPLADTIPPYRNMAHADIPRERSER
jgi:hypothetical protein